MFCVPDSREIGRYDVDIKFYPNLLSFENGACPLLLFLDFPLHLELHRRM